MEPSRRWIWRGRTPSTPTCSPSASALPRASTLPVRSISRWRRRASSPPSTGVSTAVTPVTRRVIPAATAQTLTTMLTGVVDDTGGEGFEARIPGFAGEGALKTGTAQEPTNGTYQGALADSVVGYLPASNPQFTMLVDINDAHVPASDNYGSILAAPVFKQMAEQIIDQ